MRSKALAIALLILLIGLAGAPMWARSQPSSGAALASETLHAPPRVTVVRVGRAPIVAWRFAEGVTQALRKEFLFFETTGRVVEIGAAADGAPLREGARVVGPSGEAPEDRALGQMLARLDDRAARAQLARATADEKAALRRVEAARADRARRLADLERQQALQERGQVSIAAFDAAESAALMAAATLLEAEAGAEAADAAEREAQLALDRTVLRAPFDGVVALMDVRLGDFPALSEEATTATARERDAAIVLIDDAALEIVLQLPPFQAHGVKEGQRALVALEGAAIAAAAQGQSHPDVVDAEVWSVSPSVSLERRAVLVRVRSTDALGGRLRDGDFVSVWIAAAERNEALALPYDAVIMDGDDAWVFVLGPDDRAERRSIEIGLSGLDLVEVTAGLSDGERVVARGHHLLRDGDLAEIIGSPSQ